MIAQPLTAWALVLVVTTFATNDYTSILKQAIGCALASLLLVALVFRRVSRFNQVLGTGLGVVDLFVLWHAGFERGLVW
jgi:hypothetical protein